ESPRCTVTTLEDLMHRSTFKSSSFIVLVALALCSGSPASQEKGTSAKKIIFADGGWGTSKDALPLMRYFIGLTGKPNPKVCLLPTASGDSAESIVNFYDVMNQLECRPRH